MAATTVAVASMVAAAGAAERNQAHMTSAVVLAGDGAVVG
jgi:hypothetical protein